MYRSMYIRKTNTSDSCLPVIHLSLEQVPILSLHQRYVPFAVRIAPNIIICPFPDASITKI